MTDSELFLYIKNKSDYKQTGLDFDWKVEVDHESKEVQVYFKETDSKLDWRINFNFLPTFLKLGSRLYIAHRGYVYAYLSAKDEVMKDVFVAMFNNPDYKLCCYAWSYGSAVTGLFCADMFESYGRKVDKVITYGSVKMWYYPFNTKYLVEDIKEYTTPNDFVTWQAPFCHRINKVKVGEKFSLRKIFKTEYYHTNYDKFIKE